MQTQFQSLRKDHIVRPLTCPFCGSYFWIDNKCEDCGKTSEINSFEKVFNRANFFNLIDEYHQNTSRIMKFVFFLGLEKYNKRYKNLHKKLNYRLNEILNFLTISYRLKPFQKFLLIYEAKQIILFKSHDDYQKKRTDYFIQNEESKYNHLTRTYISRHLEWLMRHL